MDYSHDPKDVARIVRMAASVEQAAEYVRAVLDAEYTRGKLEAVEEFQRKVAAL